jgi:hypothetical protein
MPRSTWRGCRESFNVAEPDDEGTADPLGRKLASRDELSDAIP